MTKTSGSGLYPPNPKQWANERRGLALREELRIPLDCALPCDQAFGLLPGTIVLPLGAISGDPDDVGYLRGPGASSWSGLALPLSDGRTLVLYNDAHPVTRTRATLMEEFFHLRLRHPLTVVRVYDDGKSRTHDAGIEAIAYGSGAAALVPFQALSKLIDGKAQVGRIADRFQVSNDLVVFRAKVTKLYRRVVF